MSISTARKNLSSVIRHWGLLGLAVLVLIIGPFLLFGEGVEQWTAQLLQAPPERLAWVALILSALLAADVVAPVPSSMISTGAGFILGFILGTLVSWVGMTLGCLIGYWLGARFGRKAADYWVGQTERAKVEQLSPRFGDGIIVICRPIPVLAEASTLLAGLGRMPLPRFLLLSALSNLGISLAYAAVGAFSATVHSFLLAFAGAILIPLALLIVMRFRP